MDSAFRLVMRTGPTVGKVFPLDKNEIFIGRDLANDISINDPEVSRRHARIFLQGNNYVLEDLGSTNGTMVGGQRLMGPYLLRPMELIVFGEQVSLMYEIAVPDTDATIAASAPRTQEPRHAQAMPVPNVRPVPQPVPQPEPSFEPAYSGHVPAEQEYYEEEIVEKKKFPVWIIALILILLLVSCVCVVGLYLIDSNSMWCQVFGFLFNILTPGACP
jgi:pSer/pThr/pTyr-binding forkhead associated (FHA) protein